jgi:methyl-accepting chemotaxis protein
VTLGAGTRQIAASIRTAAGNTAKASNEIQLVEQATNKSIAAIAEVTGWTAELSARADDLDTKVKDFFARVREA